MRAPDIVRTTLLLALLAPHAALAIPTFNPADADPSVVLGPDLLTASFWEGGPRAVRSTTGIAPGSGVYYYEGHRLISVGDGYLGFGVASAEESLMTTAGSSDQSFGCLLNGNVNYNSQWQGTMWGTHDTYGFVVDYRGQHPVVSLITSTTLDGPGYVVARAHLTAVSGPVYAFVNGLVRYDTGNAQHAAINATGPFRFDARAAMNTAFYRGGEIGIRPWFDPEANRAPTLSVTAPRAVAVGGMVSLSATAIDDGDGDVADDVAWSTSTGVTGTGATFSVPATRLGALHVTATVTDSAGAASTRTVDVTVVSDPSGDRDGDGTSNLAEALAGTNPRDPNEWPGRGVVRFDAAQRDPSVTLSSDGLTASFGATMGAVRSDVTVAPHSGWYYFEGHRTGAPGNYGIGVASDTAALDQAGGDDDQSFGVLSSGGARYDGNAVGSFPDVSTVDTYGFAVDYSGDHPIVHVLVSCVPVPENGGPYHMDGRSCTYDTAGHAGLPILVLPAVELTAIDGPIHVFAFGSGGSIELNAGGDLHAQPFRYPGNYVMFGEGHPAAEFMGDGWGPAHTWQARPVPVEHEDVRLIADSTTNYGVNLQPDGLGANFTVYSKSLVRANQAMIGEFRYFESHREVPWGDIANTPAIGQGLITAHGQADPYPFVPQQPSIAVNSYSGIWRNLVHQESYDAPNIETYGFAVDYRGARPIVYIILGGVVQYSVTLTDVFLPLYPMVYGHNTGGDSRVVTTVNFGQTAFDYDPTAALQAAGVDTSAFMPGWGYYNRPAAYRDDDEDGLTNTQEIAQGTDPLNADSDGDGISDPSELAEGTSPTRADSDHDGMPDGVELAWALDPNDAADGALDADGDGATNIAEYLAETDATNAASTPPSVPPTTMSPTDRAASVALTPDLLGVGYNEWTSHGVRSTVGITPGSGFFYFEGRRLYEAQDYGIGVVSAQHPLDDWGGATDQGIGANTLGSCWTAGNFAGSFPSGGDVHGFAVDYRGAHPIFYLIAADAPGGAGAVWVTQELTGVTTPLYIYVYGKQTFGVELHRVNVGASPFTYDARAILTAASVPGADELRLGWYELPPRLVNQAPLVTIVGGDRNMSFGDAITLSATARDDLGDLSAIVRWTHRESGATGIGANFTFTPSQPGANHVVASVRDADGWSDSAVVTIFADATTDDDGDGVNWMEEQSLGTDPNDADSDDDGLADGAEVTAGTDPLEADSDGDGVDDGWEVDHGLDPLYALDVGADPDGDRYSMRLEFIAGSDPFDTDSDPRSAVRLSSTDRHPSMTISADGLSPLFGTMDQRAVRTNFAVQPGSGLYYFECRRNVAADLFGAGVGTAQAPLDVLAGFNDYSFGASFDGVLWAYGGGITFYDLGTDDTVGFAVDYRGAVPTVHVIANGVVAWSETLANLSGPLYAMAFGGERGAGGAMEVMNFGGNLTARPFHWDPAPILAAAGVANAGEVYLGWSPVLPDSAAPDRDGDGIDDATELTLGTLPLDPDTDNDGLWDGDEVNARNTDPLDADTDDDTMLDGAEIAAALDPLVADGALDADGDGYSNAVEVNGGTNPHDNLSWPGAPTFARMSSTDHHAFVQLSTDRFGVSYLTSDFRGGRSDVAIAPGSGFYYYEGTNLVGAGYHGFGVATAAAPLDLLGGWTDQSVGASFNNQVYANGGYLTNVWTPSNTYGLAVDYRGANPVVHFISDGYLVVSVPMPAVTAPLYLYVWGGFTGQEGVQQTINTGFAPFAYDARTILSGNGIDASTMTLGVW